MKYILTTLLISVTLVSSGQPYDTTKNYFTKNSGNAILSLGKLVQHSVLIVYSQNGEKVMEIDTANNVFIKDTLQALKQIFRYAKGEQDSVFRWLYKLSLAEEVLQQINSNGTLVDREKYIHAVKKYKSITN